MRTVITHFDGDPFVTEFWLRLYSKYWRGEVNKVICDVCYDTHLVPEPIIEYQKELFSRFPEITVFWQDRKQIPELSNNKLIPMVTEGNVLLIESDGFIFGGGVVDRCFKKLEEGYDMVTSEYAIVPHELRTSLQTQGYMRCFMFIKNEILQKIEIDLMPRHLSRGMTIKGLTTNLDSEIDCDCFGWMAIQLACLKLKIYQTEANLCEPDFWDKSERYRDYPWVHVRQMNSSCLGYGSKFFVGFLDKDKKIIKEAKKALAGGVAAEWQYIKALAFRLLMIEGFEDKNKIPFYFQRYKETLWDIIGITKINFAKVAEMKGYFKGLMRL